MGMFWQLFEKIKFVIVVIFPTRDCPMMTHNASNVKLFLSQFERSIKNKGRSDFMVALAASENKQQFIQFLSSVDKLGRE